MNSPALLGSPWTTAIAPSMSRWIMSRLRHRSFLTLTELNQAIHLLLQELNARPFKKLEGSRQSQFEAIDRPALKPLPLVPYQYAEWKLVRVPLDYHVEVHGHYYSVPHALVKCQLDARITVHTVELFQRGRRIAALAAWDTGPSRPSRPGG